MLATLKCRPQGHLPQAKHTIFLHVVAFLTSLFLLTTRLNMRCQCFECLFICFVGTSNFSSHTCEFVKVLCIYEKCMRSLLPIDRQFSLKSSANILQASNARVCASSLQRLLNWTLRALVFLLCELIIIFPLHKLKPNNEKKKIVT